MVGRSGRGGRGARRVGRRRADLLARWRQTRAARWLAWWLVQWRRGTAAVTAWRLRAARRRGATPRVGRFGSVDESWLGVHQPTSVEYLPRDIDVALERALGGEGPLVVVAGEPGAGATRSTARAARRMRGGGRVVAPTDPYDTDVAALVATAAAGRARSDAASPSAVVWLDGAPVAVLDQLTAEVVDAARVARVLIVVTTRPALLAIEPADANGARPWARGPAGDGASVITVPALTTSEAIREPFRAERGVGEPLLEGSAVVARLDPVGWSSPVPLAIARVAATWEALGVPVALTPERLAELVPVALRELDVPTARTAEPDAVREEVRVCAQRPVAGLQILTATRRRGEVHLLAHPLLRRVAVHGLGAYRLVRTALSADERRALARTALALGEVTWAAAVMVDLAATGFGVDATLRIARRYEDRLLAARWYRRVLELTEDDAQRDEARLGLATVLDAHLDESPEPGRTRQEIRELMRAVAPHPRALLWLGSDARRCREDTAARAWWVDAADGPDEDIAAEACWLVGQLDADARRDDQAVPYLERASRSTGSWTDEATLTLARALRRLGRLEEAESWLHELRRGSSQHWAVVATELGRVAEARDDPAAAAGHYSDAMHHRPEAYLRLVELDLAAGLYDVVARRIDSIRVMPEEWDDTSPWELPELEYADATHQAWAAWLAAEAAYRSGDLTEAKRWLAGAQRAPGERASLARLRAGQIAIARGDVLDGYRQLQALAQGTSSVATVAAAEAAAVETEARRLANRPVPVFVRRDGSHYVEG